MKFLRHLLRYFLSFTSSPLMLLWLPPLLLVALLLSPTISPALVQWLDQNIPGLTLKGLERQSFSRFSVEHFALELPLVDVNVEQAVLDLDLSCSWRLTLCVNDAKAHLVAVNWRLPDEDEPSSTEVDDEPLEGLPLPFAINIKQLQLEQLQLAGTEVVIDAHNLELAGSVDQQGVIVEQLKLVELSLELLAAAEKPSSPEPFTPKQLLAELSAISLPFVLDIHEAKLQQLQLQLPEQPLLPLAKLQLAGRWQQQQVRLHKLQGHWQHYQLALDAELELAGDLPLTINANLRQEQHEPLLLALTGSLLRPNVQLSSAGSQPLLILANGRFDQPNWPFALSINGQLPEYIGQPLGLSAQQLQITLLGDKQHHWLAGGAQVKYNDLISNVKIYSYGRWLARSNWLLRAETDEGRLIWRGRVRYEAEQLELAGRWSGHGLSLQRLAADLPRIERMGGGAHLRWRSSDDWLLQLFTVRGRFAWRSQEWRLHAGLDLGPQAVNIRRFYLTSPAGRITAFGEARQQWQLRGELDINPYLLTNLPGHIESMWSISGPWASPTLVVNALANMGDGNSQLDIKQLKLTGEAGLYAPYQHRWQLSAYNLRYGEIDSQVLTASGEGSLEDWQITTAASAGKLQWFMAATGRMDEQQQWVLALNQASVTIADRGVALNAPVQFQQLKDGWTLSEHCWRGQPLSLCIDQAAEQKRKGVFSSRLERLDLSWLSPLLPSVVQLNGEVTGQLAMSRTAKQPWQIAAQLANNGVNELLLDDEGVEERYPLSVLQLDVSSDERRLRLSGQLVIDDHGAVQLQLDTANNAAETADVSGQLQLQQLSLTLLDPLLGDRLELSGFIDGQLQLSGLRHAPLIHGQVTASKLQCEAEALGLVIDDGDVAIEVEGDTARITHGQLQAKGGSVALKGQLNWLDSLQGQLQLAGNNWPLEHEMANLRLDSDLRIDIEQPQLRVAGKVTVREGAISVQDLPPSAVSVSSDERLVYAGEVEQNQYWQTLLNVELALGNKLQLQAFGLSGRLAGQLRARDDGKGLQLQGELAIKNGRFKAYGQNLIMRKAVITFNGPPQLPVLNVEAIRDPDETEDGVIAGLRVSGVPGRAEVQVFSEPSLAEQRALSYLLQGRDLESGEGGNAMAVAAIGLGVGAVGSLVGDVGDVFGVDDLALGTSGSGDDAKITVGGSVLPGVSVRYGRGIFSAVSELTLRIRVLRNLYLEAVSSTDNALDFIYSFEF